MAHPYHPATLDLPSYTATTVSPATLAPLLGGLGLAVLALAWRLLAALNPTLTVRARATACWFLFCGLLHIHFEGYFVRHRRSLAARTDLVGALWKEYALSDSRYLLAGAGEGQFVFAIEVLTVVRAHSLLSICTPLH